MFFELRFIFSVITSLIQIMIFEITIIKTTIKITLIFKTFFEIIFEITFKIILKIIKIIDFHVELFKIFHFHSYFSIEFKEFSNVLKETNFFEKEKCYEQIK